MTIHAGNDTGSRVSTSDFISSLSLAMDDYLLDYPPSYHDAIQIRPLNTSRDGDNRLGGDGSKSIVAYDQTTSFKKDFYYRVHILPTKLDVGILPEKKTYDVEVWNSWFDNKTLNSVSHQNIDGISIASPAAPPLTFTPLQSLMYEYTIEREGSVEINANSIYDFGDEQPALSIIGSRAILFDFEPNWGRLIDRFEWKTDVLRAHSGKEQRIKRRGLPRRIYEYDLVVTDKQKRKLEAIIWGRQSKNFMVPIWQDTGLISSGVAIGDLIVYVDTKNLSYEIGGLAVLISGEKYEVVEIEAVNNDSILLKSALLNNWTSDTKIIPAFIARMSDNISLSRFNANVNYGIVSFKGEKSVNVPALTGEPEYRGIQVLEKTAVWNPDPSVQWTPAIDVIDFGGIIGVDDLTNNNESTLSMSLIAINRLELTWLKQFFYSRQGKLKPLWLPSGSNDLVIFAQLSSASTSLIIEHSNYVAGYALSINKRDIRIELQDGTLFYRRIVDAVVINDSSEQLEIDSPLGITIEIEDVSNISIMSLCRLDSDISELSWFKHNSASTNINFRTINHDL
ncbi:hypothetical protein KAT92_04900 [Candidatus Babeliales bacterium]|nr:hypothetical protein [Candidatus Babeliales bacterium]